MASKAIQYWHLNGLLPMEVPLEDYLQCQTHCNCLNVSGTLYTKCVPSGLVIFLVMKDQELWQQVILSRFAQNRYRFGNRQQIRDTHDNEENKMQRIQIICNKLGAHNKLPITILNVMLVLLR